jgi:NADH dehydrogenase/NADH:ubiquinone oxidoreductase subunit G
LQAKYLRSIDPQAWLVLNPPKIDGPDQVFKNPQTGQVTFTIKAEKAPNRVGGEKVIAHCGGNTCDLAALAAHLKAKKVHGLLVSVDPINHNDDEHKKTLAGAASIVTLATRRGGLYEKATISMPSCTWAEKEGVYENFAGQIQPFAQAILPLEDTRSAGRIFWDLLGRSGSYSATRVRQEMDAAGLVGYAQIVIPQERVQIDEMQFAEL